MKYPFRFLMLCTLLALSLCVANASFCTTYFANSGAGVCVNIAGSSAATPNPLSASAVFEVSGNSLNVTLINDVTGVTQQLGGADVLDALLFNITNSAGGAVSLTSTTASLTPVLTASPNPLGTASIINPDGSTIKQTWALSTGQNHYFTNQYAVTATGLVGPAGGKANFGCTTNVNPATDCHVLGGPQWGIAPASYPSYAPGITPLIKNYAFFTLSGLAGSGLTNSNLKSHLSNFVFQYGTSFSEPYLTCISCGQQNPVPEPSQIAFLLLASSLIAFVAWRKNRTPQDESAGQ